MREGLQRYMARRELITQKGKEELAQASVSDKVGFVISK